MRIHFFVALATAILVTGGAARARESTAQDKASATVSTTAPEVVDDEAFSHYEKVIAGVKPPKATRAPDADSTDAAPGRAANSLVRGSPRSCWMMPSKMGPRAAV